MTIDDMNWYTRRFDLLRNRVGICNQIMGCRYHHAHNNIMTCSVYRGWCSLHFCGELVTQWKVWDIDGLEVAITAADQYSDCLWLLAGHGHLVKVAET